MLELKRVCMAKSKCWKCCVRTNISTADGSSTFAVSARLVSGYGLGDMPIHITSPTHGMAV